MHSGIAEFLKSILTPGQFAYITPAFKGGFSDAHLNSRFMGTLADPKVADTLKEFTIIELLIGIPFFIPSAPFPPKARGRWGFD
jgi:hypothetical protein